MKKKTFSSVFALLGAVTLLTACGGETTSKESATTSQEPTTQTSTQTSVPVVVPTSISAAWKTAQTEWFVGDSNQVVATANEGSTPEFDFVSSNTEVATIDASGNVSFVGAGNVTLYVNEVNSELSEKLSVVVYASRTAKTATGGKAYNLDYNGRAEVLGKLEKYAIDKGLTGTSLYENGGYVMYNPRIVKGTNTYITGYGYGILSEGSISADLENETNAAWKRYYHAASSEDPATINALNSDGSLVSDLYGYISAGYFGTKLNSTKDGYVWFPQLASEKPIAVVDGAEVANPSGKYSTWKIKLRKGAKYSTNSSVEALKAFNGTEITLDDYVNAYRVLLTQKFGLFRSAENASPKNSGFIVGADSYYKLTKDAETSLDDFKKSVSIVENTEENSLTITLGNACNQFYAMYYLNTYNPLPQKFLDAIGGVANLGNFVEASGLTPVDTSLSVGPYTVEAWNPNEIVFKRNDNYIERASAETVNRYTIAGVHQKILPALKTDQEAALKEFLAGNLDSCRIPETQISKYASDPRTSTVKGNSVFKLNFNALDQETWIKLFGVNGTVSQAASVDAYYQCKPIMSNSHFIKGISLAIDRTTYAVKHASIPSQNYFSSAYLINPEEGISYNDTAAHKKAIADSFPATLGYNLDEAKEQFKLAVEQLVEDGKYELGTKDNPTVVEIMTTWMNPSQVTTEGTDISQFIETAFNDDSVAGGKIQLKVNNEVASASSYSVVYDRMKKAQFDIGFGSITGMQSDPLGFMEVLKSDNSSGFTLNWGVDTSEVSKEIFYDNSYWSFDSLWTATTKGAIIGEDGKLIDAIKECKISSVTANSDGSYAIDILMTAVEAEGVTITLHGASLYISGVGETEILFNPDGKGHLVGTLPADYVAAIPSETKQLYLCCYYSIKIGDIENETEFDIPTTLAALKALVPAA